MLKFFVYPSRPMKFTRYDASRIVRAHSSRCTEKLKRSLIAGRWLSSTHRALSPSNVLVPYRLPYAGVNPCGNGLDSVTCGTPCAAGMIGVSGQIGRAHV